MSTNKSLEPPVMDPLNLVTMTIGVKVKQNFNLKVIAEKMEVDNKVTGNKYLSVKKGDYKKDGNFKNQCTFNINVGDKIVSTKLFNNGKIVNVGCLSKEHARITTKIVLERIQNMEHEVEYYVPDNFNGKHPKKFLKGDILKKYGSLYQFLIKRFDMKTDLSLFEPGLSANESFLVFKNLYKITIMVLIKNI